eukprot:NODE_556_length_6708_cov_0.674837.p4 type:complete len:117 gc:universal NODE_556_length_6708_cov_0.674837:6457-6107(-)
MTHSLQFLKLYLIHCFDRGDPLPSIDKPFVNAVMKILCEAAATGRKPRADSLLSRALRASDVGHHELPQPEHSPGLHGNRCDNHVREQHQAALLRVRGEICQRGAPQEGGYRSYQS